MSEISTREEFKDILIAIADVYDEMAARIVELEEMARAAAQRIEELTARIKGLKGER